MKEEISNCILCNKQIVNNEDIRKRLCLNCLAFIIQNIDIEPHEDYQQFIDFANNSKHRLLDGEKPEEIFKNIPKGFEDWLNNNFLKTGYGITVD